MKFIKAKFEIEFVPKSAVEGNHLFITSLFFNMRADFVGNQCIHSILYRYKGTQHPVSIYSVCAPQYSAGTIFLPGTNELQQKFPDIARQDFAKKKIRNSLLKNEYVSGSSELEYVRIDDEHGNWFKATLEGACLCLLEYDKEHIKKYPQEKEKGPIEISFSYPRFPKMESEKIEIEIKEEKDIKVLSDFLNLLIP